MEIQRDNSTDKGLVAIPYSSDLFHNDRDFYLAYRKIEHIVSAVFLITGLIEQDELLKQSLREHSLNCLSKIVSLIGKSSVAVADLQSVAAYILHLNSLLDITFWSGQISQMNLSILQQQVTLAYKDLNDLSSKYKNTFYISSAFFKTPSEDLEAANLEKDKRQTATNPPKTSIKDNNQKGQSKGHEVKDKTRGHIKDNNQTLKGQRREAILGLLRTRENLTVRDFTSVVPEYSEKTIQRELLALVDEGVIKKQGERRWSTYSLAL